MVFFPAFLVTFTDVFERVLGGGGGGGRKRSTGEGMKTIHHILDEIRGLSNICKQGNPPLSCVIDGRNSS